MEESLLAKAKEHAASENRTLTSLIEEGLQLAMKKTAGTALRKKVTLPVSRCGGGLMPGVDLASSAELLDKLEGRR